MSMPNLTNNIIQPQNIVINQVPLSHAIMTNVNTTNGIPLATTLQPASVEQSGDMKTGIVVETIPIAAANIVGVQSVPVQSASPVKPMNTTAPPSSTSDTMQVITKTRMADLVRDIDPNIYMEDEVEELLLNYVDDFVDRVLDGASLIAKHRHVNTIEVKDVQQYLSTFHTCKINLNIFIKQFYLYFFFRP